MVRSALVDLYENPAVSTTPIGLSLYHILLSKCRALVDFDSFTYVTYFINSF